MQIVNIFTIMVTIFKQ